MLSIHRRYANQSMLSKQRFQALLELRFSYNMDQVNSSNHPLIDYNAVNQILDKIANWPKSSEVIKIENIHKRIFYFALITLILMLVSNWIFYASSHISKFINTILLVVFLSYNFILKFEYIFDNYKKYKLSILKSRLSLMKTENALKIDFISWLQNYHSLDRQFAYESIADYCERSIKYINIWVGKIQNIGVFSTVIGCITTSILPLIYANINPLIIMGVQSLFAIIGLIYALAIIDIIVVHRLQYFLPLIKKSIDLQHLAVP